jgi:hypothetical protein
MKKKTIVPKPVVKKVAADPAADRDTKKPVSDEIHTENVVQAVNDPAVPSPDPAAEVKAPAFTHQVEKS